MKPSPGMLALIVGVIVGLGLRSDAEAVVDAPVVELDPVIVTVPPPARPQTSPEPLPELAPATSTRVDLADELSCRRWG